MGLFGLGKTAETSAALGVETEIKIELKDFVSNLTFSSAVELAYEKRPRELRNNIFPPASKAAAVFPEFKKRFLEENDQNLVQLGPRERKSLAKVIVEELMTAARNSKLLDIQDRELMSSVSRVHQKLGDL